MKRTCPQCQTSNPEPAQQCIRCGAPLVGSAPPSGVPRGNLCPAGRHPMDPGWDECPYCKADPPPSRQETVVESPPRGVTTPENPPPSRKATAQLPPPRSPAHPPPPRPPRTADERRRTRFDETPYQGASGPGSRAGSDRRIVALLVTYSWNHAGEVFPVRQGRTDVGRGDDCDVCVPGDSQMSSRHATIIHRGRGFWIDDEKSMNGTWVNDVAVETKQRLPNGARIRTGGTTWRFVVVDPEGEG